MRSILALAATIGGGLAFAVGLRAAALALNFPEQAASAAAVTFWLLFAVTSFAYFSLRILKPSDLRLPADATNLQQARFAKAEGKRQTAVFRMAFVYAMAGGAAAQVGEADAMTTGFVVVGGAILGVLVGIDWKKRYDRVRERLLSESTPEEKE